MLPANNINSNNNSLKKINKQKEEEIQDKNNSSFEKKFKFNSSFMDLSESANTFI